MIVDKYFFKKSESRTFNINTLFQIFVSNLWLCLTIV